jgi:hypothetical protein
MWACEYVSTPVSVKVSLMCSFHLFRLYMYSIQVFSVIGLSFQYPAFLMSR